jgi:hypothetical protein
MARKGADAIPYRLDEHELAVEAQNSFAGLMPAQVSQVPARLTAAMPAGVFVSHIVLPMDVGLHINTAGLQS